MIIRGARDIISAAAGPGLIAEAENWRVTQELIEAKKPAIAILDVRVPQMSGMDVVWAIQTRGLPTAAVILAM
jgi:YesN/AraC family two-component response regulator